MKILQRMTLPTKTVIRAIDQLASEDKEIYGYEIGQRTDLDTGTIYPILDRLTRAGWLVAHWNFDTVPARKSYTLGSNWDEFGLLKG